MPTLKKLDASILLTQNIQRPRSLLGNWLLAGSIGMIYGPSGIGKTNFSLSIAVAVASGCPILGWPVHEASRVLYVDGEMSLYDMQQRVKNLTNNGLIDLGDRLQLINLPSQRNPVLNLLERESQKALTAHTENIDLVIIDNLVSLTVPENENDTSAWTPIRDLALELRGRNISTLVIHHSAKSGGPRGTGVMMCALDYCIELKKPSRGTEDSGARFNLVFEKLRSHVNTESLKPGLYQLINGEWQVPD